MIRKIGIFRPRALLWVIAGLYITGPWFYLNGIRIFGVDGGGFRFFGALLTPSRPQVLLPALLALLFSLLWIAGALGRYWCGRLCPQSLVSLIGEHPPKKQSAGNLGRLKRHLKVTGYAALIALSSAMYFQNTSEGGNYGFSNPGPAMLVGFFAVFVILWLDGIFVGRSFCRTLCPYGKLLSAFSGSAGLGPHLGEGEKTACIDCSRCVKSCPMGLDVRGEAGPECIFCDRCVEACEEVFRDGRGLITYLVPGGGWVRGVIFKPRNLPLLCGAVIALAVLVQQATLEVKPTMDVRIAPDVAVRLIPGGGKSLTIAATVRAKPGTYGLSAIGNGGEALTPWGLSEVVVGTSGRAMARIPVFLGAGTADLKLSLLDGTGREVTFRTLSLPLEEGGVR